MLQSIMGYGYPPCGQTNKVKVLPSRRTTYAGGNKYQLCGKKFYFEMHHKEEKIQGSVYLFVTFCADWLLGMTACL